MTKPNRRNDQSASQEEQSQTDAHSASLQMQMHQFVPYIEGPKMDWTVNDGLYHRFLKWKLKCENILDCELATLSETRQCKKLISWSGDDGMDLVVSWGLTDGDITLETLWNKFEEFCKPQANEVRARFDLLTSFRQGEKSVDEWFNAVQKQVNLCKYPPQTANILQRDIFWFYLKDEDFVSKTLNEGCADLEQYPASKVRQLAKKLESSKATARHIKQATSNPQAAQINLLRHQRTELAHKKKKGHKRKQHFKSKDSKPPSKKLFNPSQAHSSSDRCSKCGDTKHAQGFACPAKKYLCKACKKYGHFTSLCFSKQKPHTKLSAYQITAEEMDNTSESGVDENEDSYSDDSFILYQMRAVINQAKSKVPKKTHLIANIPYRIKQHQAHHNYLRVRLDTCADVNIMPKSVYQMMFNDPDVKHLADNDISLGVYTDHQVNILGKCNFFMLHPDSKKPLAVTFYIASNEGSVLLSCTTLLALDLIQTRPRLDYLPPRAKLVTSAADHPDITRKTAPQAKGSAYKQYAHKQYAYKNYTYKLSVSNQRIKDTVEQKVPQPKPMAIIKRKADIKDLYADVFEGVGRFPGEPYHIQIDSKVPPKQTPVRPVAVHLKEAFKQELDKMLQAGYIKPVHEATPWINSFVIVEGKDKLGKLKIRICLDPTNLNVAVVREPWFSKTPDDIAHMLADAVIITTTDCTKGFWHEALDEESSYLTTFGTEFGRYRFTVMPFGISVAGDVFQRKLDTIFGNLPQVACIADDIIVVGYKEDHSDHDAAFSKLLHTARKNNVKLNYDKLQYKQTQVDFFGETYTTDGRKPSSDKVNAIASMPQPVNKKELQSFIGMVNYLSKFTPRLSELAECLRDLIRIHVPFQWGPEHTEAFTNIKQEIIKAPVLKYYDPKKPTVLQTDASVKGLGACLLQCEHPVYFGSKALTDSQKGYVAIELEALAVSWAMEKFHHFLYATKFVLETDQKPLETILAKSLNAATPRLQRILIKTFAYDFTVKYLPGEQNQLADCLSRLGCLQDKIKLPRLRVHLLTTRLSATSDKLQQIRQATQDDNTMALLKYTITHGWPRTVQELPQELQAYWTFREDMIVEDGLILKATRIVIPSSMRESILQQLHDGHLGFTKCYNRAKQTVYWPNLRKELEDLVLNCQLCLKHSHAKRKPKPTPSFGQEIPAVPWTKLASDIFHFQNDSYLLIVDFTTRFPVVRKLTSMTAKHVASHFSQVFSEYGWPDTLLTDNGPCYASQEFKKLMLNMSVKHPTDALKPPKFDWNSHDQYEDFRLFQRGMESWYKLQGITEKEGDDTQLEYLLTFLGLVGRKKHKQWTPDGATPVICAKTKKSAREFMKFLHAGMDHPVSQRCRIYQLEEIRIKAGETPDELVDRIRGLADRCNFPTDAEKE